jgi:hypothetical protein
LSDDGQTMTRTSSGERENGDAFTDVMKEKRTAGTKRFEGTWEFSDVKGAPPGVDIESANDTGLTVAIPAEAIRVVLTFGGSDNAVQGPRIPDGMTMAGKLDDPRKVSVTSKMKGKVLDTETWEVSADGKTFIYTELDAGETKPIIAVYDRI